MINIVSGFCDILFPKIGELHGRGVPQGHDNNISRHSTCFTINRTQLKHKNY